MKRTIRKQALGEVDDRTHVRVLLPVPKKRGLPDWELCWVKITSGTQIKGSGVIDHEPRQAPFKLGQSISFQTQAMATHPSFLRLQHRKSGVQALLNDLSASIREAMTFNPAPQKHGR